MKYETIKLAKPTTPDIKEVLWYMTVKSLGQPHHEYIAGIYSYFNSYDKITRKQLVSLKSYLDYYRVFIDIPCETCGYCDCKGDCVRNAN